MAENNSVKTNSTNTVAFSNDLKNAVEKDNKLLNVLDPYTEKYMTYSKVYDLPDGSPLTDKDIDGIVYIKKNDAYFMLDHDGSDIDVARYGALADGVFDNAAAFEAAATAALNLKVGIKILDSADHKSYNITRTVRIKLPPDQSCKFWISSNGAVIKPNEILASSQNIFKLTHDLNNEYVFFAIGPDIIWPLPEGKVERAFDNNTGAEVSIIGSLTFDASAFPVIEKQLNPINIAIPLQISAAIIDIQKVLIKDCIGSGIRILGPKTLTIRNTDFDHVGYRDKFDVISDNEYSGKDSFGECIHIMATKEKSNIQIEGCNLKGIKGPKYKVRSRSGIVFEFCEKHEAKSTISIDALRMDNFAKCIHIEQAEDYLIKISNCEFLNFNSLLGNSVNSPKYTISNCNLHLNYLDGNESVGGMPAIEITYESNSQVIFKESNFYFVGEPAKNFLLGNTELFENCRFIGNGKEFSFYDGAKTVMFNNCYFNNVGTASNNPTFSGYVSNSILYRLINCKIDGLDNLMMKAGNQSLQQIGSVRYTQNQKLQTNNVLPNDQLIMVQRFNFPGVEFTIDNINMPSPLWKMYKFSGFVISANELDNLRDLTREELVKKEGYYILDAILTDQGWHQFSFTKIGTEPAGYEIVTINGGVTWRKSPGNGVTDLVVAFFPSHCKSFLI
ncbi:right-handed parallel beta-helix repeat-containing protein [Pedobacter cryoconitis]|uniref:Right handed beta helix domain-containing protein n=1 Tax=Pedobacter cryoconitis TaxID=188932 RepID=A0A7X0J367_9SPHI|nr:right-handed parallel beta-helix repeat-containing protein [Pedobacter cryoconitis]MBB6498942.1 hypothetical protein [Pedobacter cryoconitis]